MQTEIVLENYIVRSLIDYDDISYDDHSELLYELSGNVITHLRSYLSDEKDVSNVLQYHSKRIAELIHAQMAAHQKQNKTEYEVRTTKGFVTLRTAAYSIDASELARNFRAPVDNPQQIRSMHFGGFQKCLYSMQKFDSDSERRLAVILEDDPEVIKWFKPSRNTLQIFYHQDHQYEPDFIVETTNGKFVCEVKREDDIEDATVQDKAKAARQWCEHASLHEAAVGGKKWSYHVIPHTLLNSNMSWEGLIRVVS